MSSISDRSSFRGALSRGGAAGLRVDFLCSSCGFEVVSGRAESPCPVCREMSWLPATLRSVRAGRSARAAVALARAAAR